MKTRRSTALNPDAAREIETLRASSQRLRAERRAIDRENTALEALLLKQTKFVRQMERFLTAAEAKHEDFKRAKERILHSATGERR